MRLNTLVRIGVAALVAITVAACGDANGRIQPTAPAGYVSPGQVGPEAPGEGHEGTSSEGHEGGSTEGEAAPTSAAH